MQALSTTPDELEAKVSLAREVTASLERAVRSHRLYQLGHVLHGQATDDLVGRFLAFFERFSYLRVQVRQDRLLLADRVLLQTEARDAEVPFRLYRDGVRELRFHRGVTREEVLDFLAILETDPQDLLARGEDLVSVLWSKDFRSIDYQVIDEFEWAAEEEPGPGLEPDEVKKAREAARAIGRITAAIEALPSGAGKDRPRGSGEGEIPLRLERSAPPAEAVVLSEESLAAAFGQDVSQAVEGIHQEVEQETVGEAIRRALEVLLGVFRDGSRGAVKEVQPLLRGVAEFYARNQDLAALGHLLQNARRSGLLPEAEGQDLFEEVIALARRLVSGRGLEAYFNNAFAGDYEGLGRFLDLTGAACSGPIASIYGSVTRALIRDLLRPYLIRHSSSIPGEAWKRFFECAAACFDESLTILVQGKPQGGPELLEEEMGHADPRVRALAASTAVSWRGPAGPRALTRALRDPDPLVHIAVLKAAAEQKRPEFAPALEEAVKDRAFAGRTAWEKLNTLRALIACGGSSSFGVLRDLVEKKPLFFKRARHSETLETACKALGELGTLQAVEFLASCVSSPDRQLSELCRKILEKQI